MWLILKDPDAGNDWRQEEKWVTEDVMAGWHHRLNRHKFEFTPGDREGQGGLACFCPWGLKESDMTERLNWTELRHLWNIICIFGDHSFIVFSLSGCVFWSIKAFNFDEVQITCFSFCYCAVLVSAKKLLLNPRSQANMFFSRSFMVLALIFRSCYLS